MRINLKDIIPSNWNFIECNNFLTLFYKNKRKDPLPVVVKKEIMLNRELGVLLGFWAGDGTKKVFALTNNNLQVIQKLFLLLEGTFGVERKVMAISIPVNFMDQKEAILKNVSSLFPKIIRIHWSKYNQVRNAPIFHLRDSRKIFSGIFRLVYDYVINTVSYNHALFDGYLEGFFAAEGNVELRKVYNTLSRLSFAQNKGPIKDLVKKLLVERRIQYYEDKKAIRISGITNYKLFEKFGLHNLHPKKRKAFFEGLNNINQTQYSTYEAEYQILSKLSVPSRISSIAKAISRHRQTVREHILLKPDSMFGRGLVAKSGKERGSRGSFYGNLWSATEDGKLYLSELELINEERTFGKVI